MNWLDTQTKELLQRVGDDKPAPPRAAEFALVLLRKGTDRRRLIEAISQINTCSESDAAKLARRPAPVTINAGLTEEEALWGQFELICADSISVFLRSQVVEQNDRLYLWPLFKQVLGSAEFRPAKVRVLQVPQSDSGERFFEQFVGGSRRRFPLTLTVPYKKARIMHHWAKRVGGRVDIDLPEAGAEPTD
jgi:hypothetical protein